MSCPLQNSGMPPQDLALNSLASDRIVTARLVACSADIDTLRVNHIDLPGTEGASFPDSNAPPDQAFNIFNFTDPSKRIEFNAIDISPNETRIFSAPDYNGVLPATVGADPADPFAFGSLLVGNTNYPIDRTSPISLGNTFIGHGAGVSNTTGSANTFIGNLTGFSTTTGGGNISVGTLLTLAGNVDGINNIAIGTAALPNLVTGDHNVALGAGAGVGFIDTSDNIAIGHLAMGGTVSGFFNVGIGRLTLSGSGTMNANTAIGDSALQNAASSNNVAVGYLSLNQVDTGASNVGVGYNSGVTLTGGNGNVTVGDSADVNSATQNNCICIGRQAVPTVATDGELVIGSAGFPLTTETTVGLAGGASALPATPVTYLLITVNGNRLKIPLYNP